jgi:hypothetical protein
LIVKTGWDDPFSGLVLILMSHSNCACKAFTVIVSSTVPSHTWKINTQWIMQISKTVFIHNKTTLDQGGTTIKLMTSWKPFLLKQVENMSSEILDT